MTPRAGIVGEAGSSPPAPCGGGAGADHGREGESMIESHDAVGAATMNAPSAPCVVPDPRFGAATDVGRLRSVNEDG